MKHHSILVLIFLGLTLAGCSRVKTQKYLPDDAQLRYTGRIDVRSDREVVLIGSASSVSMQFTGDTCMFFLKNENPDGLHNFFSLELDGEDLGRTRIEGDSMLSFSVPIDFEKDTHRLKIIKSTEAANGSIVFGGVICEQLVDLPPLFGKSIEFIGNSITCGMGNDTSEIPCHTNQWYDQHNAYWAYGPIVGRVLDVNVLLSSVSGIGIYRRWNTETGPNMPEVYENTYLNTDSSKKWDFSVFTPDIVSICLGTNDLSAGDGLSERLPFQPDVFMAGYIAFIELIWSHYPETQIALLNSPMLNGEKKEMLQKCLETIQKHFEESGHKPIALFAFDDMIPQGCDYHPGMDDHMQMAAQLIPFYQELLGEN
ncbi:MAG TPA: GDSL-type esterase/lipase family protein [Prolixibacteraceae bacterium]|nr:GDSL-type esterase/lipase family protein [Prolixibacteraceae bacterium]